MIKKSVAFGLFVNSPVVVYYRESIFQYKYLLKYEAKIENTLTLVWGPRVVLLGINNSKYWVRWTVPFQVSFSFCSSNQGDIVVCFLRHAVNYFCSEIIIKYNEDSRDKSYLISFFFEMLIPIFQAFI